MQGCEFFFCNGWGELVENGKRIRRVSRQRGHPANDWMVSSLRSNLAVNPVTGPRENFALSLCLYIYNPPHDYYPRLILRGLVHSSMIDCVCVFISCN